jgi:GMP reductase
MEFIEIESIERINYVGEVIDLSVEDDESYNIECIIVHNSACTTYPATGFGSRNCQASTIYNCSLSAKKPIIADGGIKVPGDITKSLVLGSTMVMVGGMLSGFTDSPGNVAECDGKKYKEFWGSASIFQSGKTNRIEGKKNYIPFKDKSILEEMVYLEECLQSSISYAGGTNLESFNNTKWIYE